MLSIILISILLGAVVGTLFALTGAGGAVIGVPLLILSLPLSVAQAAPIALVAVSLSAWIGAIAGLRAGTARYRAAVLIAAAGGPMTLLGLRAAYRAPDELLTLIFAGILAYIAFIMWRGRNVADPSMPERKAPCLTAETGRLVWNWPCARILALAGAGTGFLSGLLGIGGGFLVVPALARATELSMQSIVATCLAVVALISTTALFFAVADGRINWTIALPFAAGAAIGMLAGRSLAPHIPGRILQKAFALVAWVVALGMALALVFRA